MSNDLVGTLMDAGMSPQDVRELLGPAYATDHDPGAPVEPEVHQLLAVDSSAPLPKVVVDVLEAARDERQPPGPQVVVPAGVTNSLPQSKDAKPIRVDTEESYRRFRNGRPDMHALDRPENSENVPDALNDLAQNEAGLVDDFDVRGAASQWISGLGRKGGQCGPDQACLLCGVPGAASAVCAGCARRATVLGLFERGAASQMYGSIPSTRGSHRVHALGNDDPFYRLQHQLEEAVVGSDDFYRLQYQLEEVLGADAPEFYRLQHQLDESAVLGDDDFYRLQRTSEERATLVGNDEFYRMAWQTEESAALLGMYTLARTDEERATMLGAAMYSLSRFMDEAAALMSPSDASAETIPLSFEQPDAEEHVATWKQGDNLYASMRVVGWDGCPRILTTTTPYHKEVGAVVGYATRAGVSPSAMLGVLDPLARTLGVSSLVPRLAASAPAVLHEVHGKVAPLVMATLPVTGHRVGCR